MVVIVGCSLPAYGKYGGGSGTEEDPYQIWDANHMNEFGVNWYDWDKHFKLMADVNLGDYTGESFNIIGESKNPFSGVFDGNGHTISNFTYNSESNVYTGLFAFNGGQIKNLGLVDADVYVKEFLPGFLGSLVGMNKGTMTNCYATGSVRTEQGPEIGGLVGNNYWATITNCYANCSVDGRGANTGGLVGFNFYGIITNCYATGNVRGYVVGGLVGTNYYATIRNCYATGSVKDCNSIKIGGLVGWSGGGNTFNSFWDIETSGQSNSYGGTGLPTAEMQKQSTFTDWDFINLWNIGENQTYPYLRVYLAADINKDGIVNFLDVAITANQWMEGVEE